MFSRISKTFLNVNAQKSYHAFWNSVKITHRHNIQHNYEKEIRKNDEAGWSYKIILFFIRPEYKGFSGTAFFEPVQEEKVINDGNLII